LMVSPVSPFDFFATEFTEIEVVINFSGLWNIKKIQLNTLMSFAKS